jgi:hypothetical protein
VSQTVAVVTSTVGSGNMTGKLRTLPVPVMVCEPMIYADMRLVDGTASETAGISSGDVTSLVVNAGTGELAAGLSGTVVVQEAARMNYVIPNDQAVRVASLPGEPARSSIFAHDTGAQMDGMAAPARRVGFFFSMNVIPTADGWRLFDAALAWLAK